MRVGSLLIALCLVAPVSAQTIYRDRVNNNDNRDQNDRANAVKRAEQNAAKTQMEAAKLKIEKAFEASPDWIEAQTQLKQAQTELETASKPILDDLKSKPEYEQAVQRQSDAKAQVAANQQNPSTATPAKLTTPATQALDAADDVTKMEEAAIAADPKAAELKAKVATAGAKLNALTQQRDAAVLADPEWIAAKKAHDQAAVTAAQNR